MSVHCFVTPPTTFGVFFVLYIRLPGSTLSGENARKKSTPHFKPDFSKMGFNNSSVVPGYVVDSSIINISLCMYGTMLSAEALT